MSTSNNKQVAGQIASAEGHTEFNGNIADAVRTIVDSVKSSKMWAFVNNEPYFLTGNDTQDEANIAEMLDTSEEPTFTLTGQLVGGAI